MTRLSRLQVGRPSHRAFWAVLTFLFALSLSGIWGCGDSGNPTDVLATDVADVTGDTAGDISADTSTPPSENTIHVDLTGLPADETA